MLKGMVTPKFLTQEVTESAVQMTLRAVSSAPGIFKDGENHHIVVLVPSMRDDRPDYPAWPNYAIYPAVLYEESRGNKKDWKYPFDEIARCKALQLWHDRNDDRTDAMPHLLFPGDTPYWGGVKRYGIVVACSGYEPHYDKMISGMCLDTMVGIAYQYWMNSDDRLKENSFLE